MSANRRRFDPQLFAVAIASLPALILIANAFGNRLGANPIEEITHATGDWTLRFLLVTLAITPARRWFGLTWLAPLRRTFGLAAFGYACLHILTFLVLDHFVAWEAILEDVVERRFITAGFAAFLCLIPLALTSTRSMMRRLGRRWVSLHRLVYLAAGLGVLHFLWLVKADLMEPLIYAALVGTLLGARVVWKLRSSPPRTLRQP